MNPHPFVKWAGGKRQLIDKLTQNLPSFNRYFEPFLGGGALLFALLPKHAVISDINQELINAYIVVRDRLPELLTSLRSHENTSEYFYEMRAVHPSNLTVVERASRFIYLNRTCYNGLYRENSKGLFNVPYGKYPNPKICDEENLTLVSRYLIESDVSIVHDNYINVLMGIKPGDFLYADPPYHKISKQSFTKYSQGDFTADDQVELASLCSVFSEVDAHVMASNANTDLINHLYRNFHITPTSANRAINSKGKDRKKKPIEVIIRNWSV